MSLFRLASRPQAVHFVEKISQIFSATHHCVHIAKILITQGGKSGFCPSSKQKMTYFRLKEQTPNKLLQNGLI